MAVKQQLSNSTFPEISFAGDKARYITPSWADLDHLTLHIAAAIKHTCKESDTPFDLVVALAKGAWPMSRSLVDYTGIKELASLGVKFYQGINQRLKEPVIYQELPVSVVDKRILLFDDVADTGESLRFAKQYLLEQGAREVVVGTLFYKPWSVLEPDFYGSTSEAWIIFPFEIREMIDLLGKNWREQGIEEAEISKRYHKLGFMEVVEHVGH